MRKVIGDSVVTVPVVGDYYSEAATNRFPSHYSLAFVGDLNGDGRLEVMVGISRWEGSGATIFQCAGYARTKFFGLYECSGQGRKLFYTRPVGHVFPVKESRAETPF